MRGNLGQFCSFCRKLPQIHVRINCNANEKSQLWKGLFRRNIIIIVIILYTRNYTYVVRQGCPLSPYLFILCAEIRGAAIRRDKLIYGIKTSNKECKVSQYADDTTLILDGTKSSIERFFLLLDIFAKLSGLKVNYEKTEALWIGSFKNRTDKLAIKQNIKWTFRKVKSLGVWFSTSVEEAAMLSYQEKKKKSLKS